jgi:hypothetical protein
MARTTTSSDAKIRDQYRRGLRRSAQAQDIAEDLERTGVGETLAISRWNRGEDPTLRAMSRANAATAARGFSAASADRGRAMQAVDEALQAEPSSDLPPVAREMYGRQRDRLIGNAEEFLRDADEYSGRRAGNNSVSVPKRRDKQAEEAEKAVQRQGLSAEDYWERNPTSKRIAIVKDWSADPEVAAARASGNISAIEQATKNARDRDRVARGLPKGPGTTEGDAAALAGGAAVRTNATRTETVSSDPNGPTVTTSRPANAAVREVDLMDLRAEADRRAKADKSRPDMEKFNATAPEREKRVAERRKENEEAGARRFAKFVADNEIEKRQVAQAKGYLKTFRQQAANLSRSAAESILDGRERNGEFWQAVENANYNMSYLNSVSGEEQLQWALDQLKEEEESRGRIDRAARASTSEQEPLISAFTGTSGGTISDLLPGYFSNINIR